MAANIIKGDELMLFKDGRSLAYATSHMLTITGNTIDINSKDIGTWGASEISKFSWEMTTENLYTESEFDALFDAMITKTPIDVIFANSYSTNYGNLLINSDVPAQNANYLINEYSFGSIKPQAGQTVTITIKGALGSNRDYFRVYNTTPSCLIKTFNAATLVDPLKPTLFRGDVVWTTTDSYGNQVANDKIQVYQFPNSSTGGQSKIDWVKLELGEDTGYGTYKSGKAIVTSLTANANTGENATFSATFTGVGTIIRHKNI